MFRFTIRDVLWLMVVVALALSWLSEHRRSVRAQALAAEREAAHAKDIQFAETMFTIARLRHVWDHRNDPPPTTPPPAGPITSDLLAYPPKPNEM